MDQAPWVDRTVPGCCCAEAVVSQQADRKAMSANVRFCRNGM
jgi:hypothetical protein